MIRLQKYLADCGIASRRKCEEMISAGRVSVNGCAAELGAKVADGDSVTLDGEIVGRKASPRHVYIMLNKPARYITSSKDQFNRPCVLDLVKTDARLFPVGRLDYDTAGLLILTNDGDFAYKLTHPKHMVEKTYIARVKGVLTEYKRRVLCEGVEIDGELTSPARVEIMRAEENFTNVKITITEGRNRQIRKMLEAVGHNVAWLKRISVGGLELGGLETGEWRELTEDEVKGLLNG